MHARENMAFSAVSAVAEQLLVATRSSFSKKAPFKMTFAGSNPACPATQCGLSYAISGWVRTADIPAG
jgi:hypothetical protein